MRNFHGSCSFLRSTLSVVAIAMLLSSCAAVNGQSAGAPPSTPLAASAAGVTPVPLKPLKITPESGLVGASVTVSGEGLPANRPVDISWGTVDGSFDMKATAETVEYYDRKFTPIRIPFGKAATDSEGRFTQTLTIPEDYGETHDVVAAVDGQDLARTGFAVVRNVTINSTQGPVGSPIVLEVKGLQWGAYYNTMAVLYDDTFSGFISAVTTRGTGQARIRAAGPPGKHVIRVYDASGAVPYLNNPQSPVTVPEFKFDYTVTEDAGPPAAALDWPDPAYVKSGEGVTRTTSSNVQPANGVKLEVSPQSGPILSKTTLAASGLPAGADLDLLWVSAKGNRWSPGGWNLTQNSLGKATVGKDGSLSVPVSIPDDLGGWHTIRLVQGENVLAEVPYFVERSLVTVSPKTVKVSPAFTVEIKGVGWTELDNTVAVTYDNSYLGYACGFNSQGDITLNLTAWGKAGTHLIDLYPTIYLGHGKGPWDYNIPQLTFARDHPSLSLGYHLPAFRLAITVVE